MKKPVIIGLLCLLSVSGVGFSETPQGTEEVLMGIAADARTLTIRVESGGCTEKKDFHIAVQKAGEGSPHHVLTVFRTRRDDCKAFLWDGVELKFDLNNLGLSGVFTYAIANKIKGRP